MLAYSYPMFPLFWTMLWFFLWFAWLMLLFKVFVDIFRNHNMGGVAKALWSIFVIIVPFLGVFIYLIANGSQMSRRDLEEAKAQDVAMRSYIQETVTSSGTADELQKLAELKTQGVITEAEFAQQKAKLLG